MRQKLSRLVLILLLTALALLGGLKIKERFFPEVIASSEIPFGIEPGIEVEVGEELSLYAPPALLRADERPLYERALLLSNTGDPNAAIVLIEALLEQHPQAPALVALLIRTAIERGDEPGSPLLATTEERLDALLAQQSRSALLQVAKAELLLQRGAAVEALDRLRAVSLASPQAAEPRLLAARSYLQIGRLDSAQQQARWAISMSPAPQRAAAYALLAEAHHRAGRLDSSRVVCDYALLLHPTHRDLQLLRARLYEYAGLFDAANGLYGQLRQLYPHDRAVAQAQATVGQKQPPLPSDETGCMGDWSAWLDDLSLRYSADPEAAALLGELRARLLPATTERLAEQPTIQIDPEQEGEKLAEYVEQAAKNATESGIDRYGHFRVRWGASEEEFLRSVDRKSFTKLAPGIWRTERRNGGDLHLITVHTAPSGFRMVQLLIADTTGQQGDFLGKVLRTLIRRSGNPRATGETICPKMEPFQGFVWESGDDFALMAQFRGKERQVRMVRVDPQQLPEPLQLCEVAEWLLDWSPYPAASARGEP